MEQFKTTLQLIRVRLGGLGSDRQVSTLEDGISKSRG